MQSLAHVACATMAPGASPPAVCVRLLRDGLLTSSRVRRRSLSGDTPVCAHRLTVYLHNARRHNSTITRAVVARTATSSMLQGNRRRMHAHSRSQVGACSQQQQPSSTHAQAAYVQALVATAARQSLAHNRCARRAQRGLPATTTTTTDTDTDTNTNTTARARHRRGARPTQQRAPPMVVAVLGWVQRLAGGHPTTTHRQTAAKVKWR
jgi:hypothetical protein